MEAMLSLRMALDKFHMASVGDEEIIKFIS